MAVVLLIFPILLLMSQRWTDLSVEPVTSSIPLERKHFGKLLGLGYSHYLFSSLHRMQLSSAVLEMIDSPALSFRDARRYLISRSMLNMPLF